LYVYEDCGGGYTVHVARARQVSDKPAPVLAPDWWRNPTPAALEAVNAQHRWLALECRSEAIGLQHDGESFNVPTAGECAALMARLKAMGYMVPDSAIAALMAESVNAPDLQQALEATAS
jgi:hypothetical protein